MSFKCTAVVSEQLNQKQLEITVDVSQLYTSSTFTNNNVSENYIICNATMFQVKVTTVISYDHDYRQYSYNGFVYIKFAGVYSDDPLSYTLHLCCDKWSIANKKFISDEGTWHLIGETTDKTYIFTISAEMTLTPTKSIFEDLFNDDELADFELKSEDGSVKMHRAILAGVSPVLRRMLSGTWRETAEGSVDVTGTSLMTLKHFKEYIYLQKLPVAGLEQLLLLAHYYMMSELENKCIFLLLSSVTAQNAYDLIKFGSKYDIPLLVAAVLGCVERGSLKVKDIRYQLGLDNVLELASKMSVQPMDNSS